MVSGLSSLYPSKIQAACLQKECTLKQALGSSQAPLWSTPPQQAYCLVPQELQSPTWCSFLLGLSCRIECWSALRSASGSAVDCPVWQIWCLKIHKALFLHTYLNSYKSLQLYHTTLHNPPPVPLDPPPSPLIFPFPYAKQCLVLQIWVFSLSTSCSRACAPTE